MADPRDVAVQWLAEQLHVAECCEECSTEYDRGRAVAILDAPGVKVDVEYGVATTTGQLDEMRTGPKTHRQIIIRLPAQPITEEGVSDA